MDDNIGGVWRTIGGRRVFIKDGEDLQTAMKNSGKFGKKRDKELDSLVYKMVKDYAKDGMVISDVAIKRTIEEDIRNNYHGDATDEEIFEKIKKEFKSRGMYQKEFVDDDDDEAIDRIADNNEDISDYPGLSELNKTYIANRRKEMTRENYAKKLKERDIKPSQKTTETKKYNLDPSRYTRNERRAEDATNYVLNGGSVSVDNGGLWENVTKSKTNPLSPTQYDYGYKDKKKYASVWKAYDKGDVFQVYSYSSEKPYRYLYGEEQLKDYFRNHEVWQASGDIGKPVDKSLFKKRK